MDARDFIKISAKEIRESNELMRLYIKLYEGAFSVQPNCAPCTFNRDFKRFKKHVEQLGDGQEIIINHKHTRKMKTFELKSKYKADILTYKDGKRPVRTYGRKMTEEFAVNFLTKGSKEEIEKRKKLFNVLPDTDAVPLEETKSDAAAKEINVNVDVKKVETEDKPRELKSLKRVELDVVALEAGLKPSDYVNKALLIAAIEKAV